MLAAAQGFVAAIGGRHKDEEEERPAAEPADEFMIEEVAIPDESSAEASDVLDETPPWMVEESAVGAETETPPIEEQAELPEANLEELVAELAGDEEPTVEVIDEPTSAEVQPEADLAEATAEALQALGVDDEQPVIQLSDEHPAVFKELEEIAGVADDHADEAVAAAADVVDEIAGEEPEPEVAEVEEAGLDVEEVEVGVEETEEEVPADRASADWIEAETLAEPQGGPEVGRAGAAFASRAGVEWGARWRESAQGWVDDGAGRSTWRPIVTTSDHLGEWDVDTYLGVVGGDASFTAPDDEPAAAIAPAREAALRAMLDEAILRGAHAVIGVTIDVHEGAGRMFVTATGTAVTLQARD
jgi:uncharacterized protein YbjQ (UPF0145 family)